MSENKIPCGGFYLGDGLTMDGDTLKSLGGAYVKVTTNDNFITFEFMDDSPLKTYEEIVQKTETSLVTLLLYKNNVLVTPLYFDDYLNDSIIFHKLRINEDLLSVTQVSIDSDNKMTLSEFGYTLTPAT